MKITRAFAPVTICIETEEERGKIKEILMWYCNEEENQHFTYGAKFSYKFDLARKIIEALK